MIFNSALRTYEVHRWILIMQEFIVDTQLRKEIIKQKRKEMTAFAKFLDRVGIFIYILSLLFLVIVTGLYIWTAFPLSADWDIYEVAIGFVAIAGGAALIAILGHAFRSFVIAKYLGKWAGTQYEELLASTKYIEYGEYDRYYDSSYYTWKINFSDVEKIVIDPSNYYLRIYGKILNREWTSPEKTHCIDKNWFEGENSYITIATFFKDFDKFLDLLKEKTGKEIEEDKIEIKFTVKLLRL